MSLSEGEESPLWSAVKEDDVDKVGALIEEGADVTEAVKPIGWTALHIAAGHGSLRVAALLLSKRANVDAPAADGETPLHLAAQEGQAKSISFLVENGATVGARNDDRETPLHTAVQHVGGKPLDHIKALLEARADPSEADGDGQTAITTAHRYTNRGEELEAILGGEQPGAPKSEAVSQRRDREVDGMLHAVCRRGQADHVSKVLELAGPEHVVGAAQRALVPAAMGGSVEVAEVLVKARADPQLSEIDSSTGMTCLVAAADEGKSRMVKWLLAHQADATVVSRDGASALMAASMRGADEAVRALLEARSDVNRRAHAGWTALMVSCQAGQVSTTRALLEARAALDPINIDGKCARDLATASGHTDVVKTLDTQAKLDVRRAKAAPKATTSDAQTMDNRDIEALLRSLGEPAAKGGKAKANKKTTKGADSSEAVPVAVTPAAPAVVAPVQPSTSAKQSAAKKSGGKKKQALSEETRAALQSRLEEIAKTRAALDIEEAEIRQRLGQAVGLSA